MSWVEYTRHRIWSAIFPGYNEIRFSRLNFWSIGLAKKPICVFFHKIKYIFFSFSPTTLLIWMCWVWQLSPAWYNTDCSQSTSHSDHYQLWVVYSTMEHHPAKNLQHKVSQTTFHTFDQSQNILHILHNFFCISAVFLHFLK